jgi:DNA end-binding protein Ku
MARALWKGAISFGLVTIPVSLYPAKTTKSDLTFHMLDKRDMRPVHNKRVDDKDHEVAWDDVVKAYEYEKDQYVVVGEEDFRAANVEATQSIDIMNFVDAEEIDTVYYETPYYLEPTKAGRKAYALLRETMKRTDKIGVAKIVIRTRQHLCAVKVDGPMLIAELLRWPYQLRSPAEFDLPSENLDELGISPQELQMAEQLVGAMVAKWEPEKYVDTYREDLLKRIDEKVKRGELTTVAEAPPSEEREAAEGKVVDIMSLLKRSMEKQQAAEAPHGEKASGDGHKRQPARKQA